MFGSGAEAGGELRSDVDFLIRLGNRDGMGVERRVRHLHLYSIG